MGTAMFGISVDTKHLDSGVTHALELEGMDYKFTVSIPQEAIVPPGHTKPEPDPLLDLVFYNDVSVGQVTARFILRATGKRWGSVAKMYKKQWTMLSGEEMASVHEEQLAETFGILLAPPESRTDLQNEQLIKLPFSLERIRLIAEFAHHWAKHMALRAFEA